MKATRRRTVLRTPVRTGLLIVLSGPGGVGKDTVIERLLQLDGRLQYSVSFTTRPCRPNEQDGHHYSFVGEEGFMELVERGEMLEHARVNGYLYGTSRARVEEARRLGIDIILKIDVQGADQVRQQCPDGLYIFLAPPSMEELMRRRAGRGTESPDVQVARQRLAEWEMEFKDSYDVVVVNDDAERAVGEVLEVIDARRRSEE